MMPLVCDKSVKLALLLCESVWMCVCVCRHTDAAHMPTLLNQGDGSTVPSGWQIPPDADGPSSLFHTAITHSFSVSIRLIRCLMI